MAESREFDLSDVLSITTGRLVSSRHMDGVYDILSFMTGQKLYTPELPQATEVCSPVILAEHPQLRNVRVPEFGGSKRKVSDWVAGQKKKFGDKLLITPLPPGVWQRLRVYF